MSNLPISNSQPAKNASSASQVDFAANSDGQAAEPFAKVLARQVDEAETPPTETGSDASAAVQEAAQSVTPSVDPNAIQSDPLAAILLQIPLEARTTTVTDRAVRLASGDRLVSDAHLVVGFDATALQPDAAVQAALVTATGAGIVMPQRAERLDPAHSGEPAGAAIQAAGERRDIITATGKPEAQFINQEQRVFADLLRQGLTKGSDMASTPADLTPPPTSLSQAMTTPLSVAPATGPSTSPAQTVATPLGSPAWADDFSQKVGWMVSQRNQVAELHLNPPNLGPLDIVLKISDNQATALFASPHAAVREAVESALPKLRELLADNGITLSNATVGDQSPRERRETSSEQRADSSAQAGEEVKESAGQIVIRPARLHDGMVDTFA